MNGFDTAARMWGEEPESLRQERLSRPRLQRRRETAFTPTDKAAVDRLWWELMRGDRITVTFSSGEELEGTLDAVADGLEAVWVIEDGHGRRMLHPADGLKVSRIEPA